MKLSAFILIGIFTLAFVNGGTQMSLKLARELSSPDNHGNNQLNGPRVVNNLLITNNWPSLIIYDIETDPLNPALLLNIQEILPEDTTYIDSDDAIYGDGSYIFLIAHNFEYDMRNLIVLDTSDTSDITLYTSYHLENITSDIIEMYIHNDVLYLSEKGDHWDHVPGTIHRYEISDLPNPTYLGGFSPYSEAEQVIFVGTVGSEILLMGYSKLILYDPVSQSLELKPDILYITTNGGNVFMNGNQLVGFKSSPRGLAVYDISNLNAVTEVKLVETDYIWDINMNGDLFFITTVDSNNIGQVLVIDLEYNILDSLNGTIVPVNTATVHVEQDIFEHYVGNNDILHIIEYSNREPPSAENTISNTGSLTDNKNSNGDNSAIFNSELAIGSFFLSIVFVRGKRRDRSSGI